MMSLLSFILGVLCGASVMCIVSYNRSNEEYYSDTDSFHCELSINRSDENE